MNEKKKKRKLCCSFFWGSILKWSNDVREFFYLSFFLSLTIHMLLLLVWFGSFRSIFKHHLTDILFSSFIHIISDEFNGLNYFVGKMCAHAHTFLHLDKNGFSTSFVLKYNVHCLLVYLMVHNIYVALQCVGNACHRNCLHLGCWYVYCICILNTVN